jgi:hypothetical protein
MKFQSSVADIVLRDTTSGQAIAHGKTNTTTSLKQTMSKTEARGGIGNQLLYTYFHDRAVEFTIEMPVFNEYILALQSGATVGTGNYSCVATECVVLASGSATLANTPTGDVTFIFDDNDASILVTPIGKDITVTGGLNRKGYAIYDYLTASDRITVEGKTQPSTVELVMTAPVYDQEHGDPVQYFQVIVPQFKVDGNYNLAMNSNENSKQSLTGNALLNVASNCSDGDYYYTATYINVDLTTTPYTIIAATPSPMTFSAASGSATAAISVLGYRGPLHSTTSLTTSCTYLISGCACFTAGSATGVVTAGSTMNAGDSGVVTVSYYDSVSGSLTDTLQVLATA